MSEKIPNNKVTSSGERIMDEYIRASIKRIELFPKKLEQNKLNSKFNRLIDCISNADHDFSYGYGAWAAIGCSVYNAFRISNLPFSVCVL